MERAIDLQVAIITEMNPRNVESLVNEWLQSQNPDVHVLDIQFGKDEEMFTVLIIYKQGGNV